MNSGAGSLTQKDTHDLCVGLEVGNGEGGGAVFGPRMHVCARAEQQLEASDAAEARAEDQGCLVLLRLGVLKVSSRFSDPLRDRFLRVASCGAAGKGELRDGAVW